MIISRIIQNGLDLSIETNDIPYQRSANHKIQFVKDPNYSNYSLQAYGKLPKTGYQESEEFKLELEDGNYIKLPSAVFATKGIFQIAISLTGVNGDIINLGIVSYKIRKSFGDSTNILPDNEKAWNSFVHLEVDNYFNNTYQSKLNDFNTKYDDTVTKYTEIVETSTEVKKEYDEVVSMKKSVESSKQSIDNTKKQIDSTYDEYKKFANDTKIEINNAKQAIINGKNEINTLAKEKVDEYTQKVTDFNNNYDTKTASLDTKINEIQTKAVEIVETSTEQLKENIAESKNDAIKQIQSEGQSYQDQINELQKSEALQDEAINKLKDDVDLKVTQPYLNNNDSTSITSSDNGLMKNIVIKGNTEQVQTTGKNLLEPYGSFPKTSSNITFDLKEDGFHINGKCSGNSSYIPIYSNTLQPGTYYVNGITGGSNSSYQLMVFKNDTIMGYATYNNFKITLSESATIKLQLYVYSSYGTFNDLVLPYMICKNESELTTYEPYTGGQPSPNPDYPQEVKGVNEISGKIVGKNIVSDTENGYIQTNGTVLNSIDVTQNEQVTKNFIKLNPKQKYLTYSYKATITKNYLWLGIGVYDEKYNFITRLGGAVSNTSTGSLKSSGIYEIPSNAKFIKVSYRKYNDGILQLEYGQTATDYQPYQSQPFNYTLQKPLYRLSDSVYDYIDVDKGKIVRNVGVVTFDGSDDEEISKVSNTNINVYQFSRAINSIEKYAKYAKCDSFQTATAYANDLLRNDNKIYAATVSCYLSFDKMNTVEKLKAYLQQNPITVYYQLATPVEEPLPSDMQTLLQSLKSYYPQTNIMFDTEVEPYINFDYKLNLKSWIEDKDNKEIIYDKQNKEKDKYSSTFFENMFALQRTGKVYTVKFPKWETSHISTGEKLDANAGLVCEPSTKSIKGQNDYANIPLFKTYDVNAYVDDEGVRHVTAIKGDKDFKDEGKVDVFVLGMSYYEKVWEDDQYWYYSRTDSPREGYTIARECINRDGSIQAFGLYAKYVAGNIDGNLYSSKGLKPARYYGTTPLPTNTTNTNTSYSGLISQCHKRGSFYSGGMTCDYKYILTTFYLKYGTLNTQSIMGGCNNYSAQYEASIKSSTNNTYFPLTKAQADYFPVGASVSIGYKYGGSNLDRYYSTASIYADNVKIIKKVALDDSNIALYLDTNTPFNTADTSSGAVFCSTMHWRSGFSDDILGRDGCPCDTKSELTNGKFPIVIQGIECMVGGYETYGNAFMDIVDATGKREVYIQNDASQLTTDVATAKSTYKKSPYAIQPTSINSWNYITKIDFDLVNGAFIQTNSGQSGSSTGSGFADGLYVDGASSGQREFLGFGILWAGSSAGLSCLVADNGVGTAYWCILARLSINGVGGELTA